MKNLHDNTVIMMRSAPRKKKRMMMLVFDVFAIPLSLWLAFNLRLGVLFIPSLNQYWLFVLPIVFGVPIFIHMGLYRAIVHYMEINAFVSMLKAVSLLVASYGILLLFLDPYGVPRSSIIIFWLILLLVIVGSRLLVRWLLMGNKRRDKPNVAIYGAGFAGMQLASALKVTSSMRPVLFLDSKVELQGHEISGLTVYPPEDVEVLIGDKGISQILIAIPSASKSRIRTILQELEDLPVQVQVLPSMEALASGDIRVESLRDVGVEELLGRDAAIPDAKLLKGSVSNKVVMVTGAGGSIGSELCRQIILQKPSKLLLFERSELALYQIERELIDYISTSAGIACEIIPLLGSVKHFNRAKRICETFRVQTIYHAAAYKHVPLVEYNPVEAVQNNIFGTLYMAQAAKETSVERFILISTDKAVRPTNVMGATKRCAELILQALNQECQHDETPTKFSMVRFGNVLGSSGSVVPLFREQIKEGGPVTLTHKDITRYFMTIPEAAQLVIQAGTMAKGGEVFVLDMGEPVKIIDLAKKLIHLSGLSVKEGIDAEGDIEILETGLRPGEKLYEELLIGEDVGGTEHPLIMQAQEEFKHWLEIEKTLQGMGQASQDFDVKRIQELLKSCVSGYTPAKDIHDILWVNKNDATVRD